MQANKTVTINGRLYDAVTGLPIDTKPVAKTSLTAKRTIEVPATSIHSTPQRSQTLHRRAVKKGAMIAKRLKPGRHMDIARSGNVSRFAAHPKIEDKKTVSIPDVTASSHPLVSRALARNTPKPSMTLSSKQVKNAAIKAALTKPSVTQPKRKRSFPVWSRRFTIITACFVVLIIGAAITYVNLPSLSVGFASAQAGIAATYPEYLPDGYRLHQPVTYKEGEVTLKFTSNSSNSSYTIVQTRSSWDSSAALDNVVRKAAGDNYVTTQEHGLTIYSYDNNAVWVNGGILYTIASNAPLSGEQIRHIATSL